MYEICTCDFNISSYNVPLVLVAFVVVDDVAVVFVLLVVDDADYADYADDVDGVDVVVDVVAVLVVMFQHV